MFKDWFRVALTEGLSLFFFFFGLKNSHLFWIQDECGDADAGFRVGSSTQSTNNTPDWLNTKATKWLRFQSHSCEFQQNYNQIFFFFSICKCAKCTKASEHHQNNVTFICCSANELISVTPVQSSVSFLLLKVNSQLFHTFLRVALLQKYQIDHSPVRK